VRESGRIESFLFYFFLIESLTFVIYFSEWRLMGGAFLALAFISEALEVVKCDSLECVRGDLGERLS